MKNFDSMLQEELDELKTLGLYRELRTIDSMQGPIVKIDGKEVILLSSNNYLGLASHPEVINAQVKAAKEFGAGSCASRLISGNMTLHERLEEEIASFKGEESAIIFSTGYMANVGTISALAGEKDLVVCDKLDHASIIDGVRLSGAVMRVYPHKNLEKLRDILEKSSGYNKKFIITDGVFSMDGDIAPIPELVEIAEEYNAILMVDDAHATGVLGKTGKGTCEHFNIKSGIHIKMGTFSKALGNLGGYVAGSRSLIDYIRNKARSFIYSTSLPPSVIGGNLAAIDIIERDSSLKDKLWENVSRLRSGLEGLGLDLMGSETQIIPVRTKDEASTMKLAELLLERGVFAPGIRPPTVPKNKCRIRTSLMATHTDEHIDRVINTFRSLKDEGLFYNRD
ncbi:MAG: 8-amino-7-oxononanoate synthase [Candidatus Omnitrophota bacterium]